MALVGLKSAAYVFLRSVRPPTSIAAVIVAVFATAACGEAIPVELSSPRALESDVELVDEAFEILGLEWELSDRDRGTIHIALLGAPDLAVDQHEGTTTLIRRCFKSLASTREPAVLAHEIGHTLGLVHVCEGHDCAGEDLDNLMSGAPPPGTNLTDEQLDELEDGRRRITACR